MGEKKNDEIFNFKYHFYILSLLISPNLSEISEFANIIHRMEHVIAII